MKAKLFLFLSLVVLIFGGCKKENDDSSTGGTSELKVKTSLTGRIFDESGIAVSGATVMAGNVTAITDQYGIYTIADVELAKERAIVTINKGGYWQQVGSCIPSAGTTTYRNFTLFNGSNTQIVNGASGGTVTHANGGSVTFPANAFVTASGTAYTGNVNVCLHRIAADDSTLSLKVPGSDLLAINAANEDGILITYGMIGVKLTDGSGNTIKIADGKKASIKFPIAVGQLSSAPATIDLWYFDESIGKWREEGTATKVGNNYEGDVAHFSWWNCDDFTDYATVNFHVIDCNGEPAACAGVEAYYFNSTGWPFSSYSFTDGNGYFSSLVPANVSLTVYAYPSGYGNSGQSQAITGIYSSLSINTLPDLIINDPVCLKNLEALVVDCSNQPIAGAQVLLVDSNNNYLGQTLSNTNGKLYFSSFLISGFVKIIVNKNSTFAYTTSTFDPLLNTNLGNIVLCDSAALTNNFQMTFVSQGLGTFTSSFQVSSCNVSGTTPNNFIKFYNYNVGSGSMTTVDLYIPDYSIGTYPWNGQNSTISGLFILNGQQYSITHYFPIDGSTIITNDGGVGGQVVGSFDGKVILSAPGQTLIGRLSTTFDIYRNH